MNILFLCTGNSCRSIIAEALFKSMAPVGMAVQSAGSKPAGFVHPRALAVLRAAGIAVEGLSSKSWDNLPEKPDAVITLCDEAAGESCPLYFGKVVRSHWGIPDPAKVTGGEEAINTAFASTLDVLRKRVGALTRLTFEELERNGQALQKVLDAIVKQYA
jgi:arsenate reductase